MGLEMLMKALGRAKDLHRVPDQRGKPLIRNILLGSLKGPGHGRGHVALLLAVLVALPAPGRAQDRPAERAGWELPVATAAIAGSNWLDVRSSRRLVAAGGVEAWNPGLYGPDAGRILPVKAAVVAGEVGIFCALRKWRREAAWSWVAVIVVGNVLIARRNDRISDRLEGGGPAPLLPPAGVQIRVSW